MRTVLITGASSGIGLATSVELAKRDWSVVATMPDREPRGELDRQLLSAGVSGHVSVDRLDVTDRQSIDRLVASLDLSNRRLDAVVHNAGIAAGGAFEDLDDTLIRHVMEVNFFGVLALTRRLLPAFRARRYGRIVIISSEAAFAGQPAISPYCASKWAIEGWAEALCYKLEPFNIQITLIEPGLTVQIFGRARQGSAPTRAFTAHSCGTWKVRSQAILRKLQRSSRRLSKQSILDSATPWVAPQKSYILCGAKCRVASCAKLSAAILVFAKFIGRNISAANEWTERLNSGHVKARRDRDNELSSDLARCPT